MKKSCPFTNKRKIEVKYRTKSHARKVVRNIAKSLFKNHAHNLDRNLVKILAKNPVKILDKRLGQIPDKI